MLLSVIYMQTFHYTNLIFYHWKIIWSSYRKLTWVWFEPMTTEFRSDALTSWAIRPWVQLTLRANFVTLLRFHRLLSVRFYFGCCLRQSPRFFNWNFLEVITWMSWNKLMYMVFTTEGLFEVAIESWHECDLNPWPLNFVQML